MALTPLADYVDGVEELKAMCGYGAPKLHSPVVSGMMGLNAFRDAAGNIQIGPPGPGQEVEVPGVAPPMPQRGTVPPPVRADGGVFRFEDAINKFLEAFRNMPKRRVPPRGWRVPPQYHGDGAYLNGMGLSEDLTRSFSLSGLGCGGSCGCAKCKGVSGLGDVDFSGIGDDPKPWSPASIEAFSKSYQYGGPLGPQATPSPTPTPGSAPPTNEFGQKVDVITGAVQKIGASLAPLFQREPRPKIIVQRDPDYTTYAIIGGAVIVASMLAIAVGKSGRR